MARTQEDPTEADLELCARHEPRLGAIDQLGSGLARFHIDFYAQRRLRGLLCILVGYQGLVVAVQHGHAVFDEHRTSDTSVQVTRKQ